MNKCILALAALLITPLALASVPSDESLRELMEITDTRQLLESSLNQTDQILRVSMEQAVAGEEISPEQQKIMDDTREELMALMKAELSWSVLEPMFNDVYKKSLTQEEVDGMLVFYRSAAGKALIAKMPLIMQNTMQLMQQRMASMAPKMQKIQMAALEKIKNAQQK